MLILQRYLLKRFLATFLASITLFVGLSVIIKITEQINQIVKVYDVVPFSEIVAYFVYEIPYTFNFVFPMATLFSIVYVLGKLNNDHELTVFYSAGRPLILFILPIAFFILSICVLFHIFEDPALYRPHQKHKELHEKFRDKTYRPLENRYDLAQFGSDNKIYLIDLFDPKAEKLQGVHILYLENNFFSELTSLAEAQYLEKGFWELRDLYQRDLKKEGVTFAKKGKEIRNLNEAPYYFEPSFNKLEDLSAAQVKREAEKIAVIGGNAAKWWTDYHIKSSAPYVALILLFLGIPLSTFSRNSVLILSFSFVIMAAFVYMVLINVGASLGHGKILPPLLAGWLGNLTFICINFFLYLKLEK